MFAEILRTYRRRRELIPQGTVKDSPILSVYRSAYIFRIPILIIINITVKERHTYAIANYNKTSYIIRYCISILIFAFNKPLNEW